MPELIAAGLQPLAFRAVDHLSHTRFEMTAEVLALDSDRDREVVSRVAVEVARGEGLTPKPPRDSSR
jgi:hypothetical protein